MKKITFLLTFLIATVGFAQTNLEDFESAPIDFTGNNGLGAANVVANPASDSTNGSATVGEIISSAAGDPWQQADLVMQDNYIDLSSTITVSVDVYSTQSFTLMARVDDNSGGGATTATADEAYTTGSGWQTLTFTFNEAIDGQGVADGQYTKIAFFPNWAGGGSGTNGTNPDWNDPVDFTVYVDNITAVAGAAVVSDPEPATAAPIPTTADGSVYAIYNDTNGYTTNFPFQYSFGTATEVNLADSGTNNALKINLNADGFGQGEGGPDDISSYDFVNFNYWFSNSVGTAGFTFIMIDNDGAVQEFGYQIGSVGAGDGEDVVEGAWAQASIPISHFTGLGFDDTVFFQWKVDRYNQSGDNGGFLYLDNITFTQGAPLSRDEFSTFESRVYPNPASDAWTISTPNNTIRSVQVFNVLGRQVASQTFDSSEASISVQSLASGIYLARVTTDAGTKTLKLIRE